MRYIVKKKAGNASQHTQTTRTHFSHKNCLFKVIIYKVVASELRTQNSCALPQYQLRARIREIISRQHRSSNYEAPPILF